MNGKISIGMVVVIATGAAPVNSHRAPGPGVETDERVALVGTVRYTGTADPGEPVDMASDAFCRDANSDRTVRRQPVVVGSGGGLQDVIVYVKSGAPSGTSPVPEEAAVLDQEACMYRPHVLAVRAGQPVVIRNSDATLHNVHVYAESNRGFNIGQPFRGLESRRTFANPEMSIEVRCDIHGWMGGVIAVFDHQFFAVTTADGRFSLDGLPPGEYVVEAWHETLGVETRTVTIGVGGSADVEFVFDG